MQKYFNKKVFLLVVTAVILTLSLAGCNSKEGKAVSKEQAQSAAETNKNNSTSSVSRLPEILDDKRFKDQFTIRAFNIDHKDSQGKVSAGDSTLLIAPDGTTTLIDTGFKEEFPAVLEYIKKLGVEKLDYVIATHMHPDHIGGIPLLLDTMPIGKIMSSKYTYSDNGSPSYILSELSKKGMQFDTIKEGDTFSLGRGVAVEVLSPEDRDDIRINGSYYANSNLINELSLVLKITYGKNVFMFTGDIQLETERRLSEKYGGMFKVDVMKVAHHGYTTSSSSAFVKAFTPLFAWVPQCRMPFMEVYQKYKDSGSKVYITGQDGILLFASDGERITLVTEKDRNPDIVKP